MRLCSGGGNLVWSPLSSDPQRPCGQDTHSHRPPAAEAWPGKKCSQQLTTSTFLPAATRKCPDLAEPPGFQFLASKTLRRKKQPKHQPEPGRSECLRGPQSHGKHRKRMTHAWPASLNTDIFEFSHGSPTKDITIRK